MSEAIHSPRYPSLVVRLRYQPLCAACTNVLSHGFSDNNDEESEEWNWSIEALRKSSISCRCCVFWLQVLKASPWLAHRNDSVVYLTTAIVGSQHSPPYEWTQHDAGQKLVKNEDFAHMTVYKRYYRPRLAVGDQHTFILPTAMMEAQSSENVDPGNAFCGRPVGSAVNLSLVQSWLNLCAKNHRSSSNVSGSHAWYEGTEEHSISERGCAPVASEPIPNFRLVDVKMRCVVCIKQKTEYAALSYVWGGSRRFVLCKENADSLSLPGALNHKALELPQTFRDAIEFVEKLAIRYIWIDALCIQQDDSDQLVAHMNSMDVI
ncbi:hypothetical protein LEMA_P091300.1 [Plenodomus lingam JN3]|uniref:Heterokaryon incompatibility domain-containing protein n=2 Tax=Leptosphaeria maculans TaxID=5022 RepID=E5A204_LEPMJ|nr:hypothetical protein LEMA_P091300.1 [Plenodomus lingam JN3]CBX97721.1 hypothetical protein LEMA_P091300.1 [Plenodomus lingam JN3]